MSRFLQTESKEAHALTQWTKKGFLNIKFSVKVSTVSRTPKDILSIDYIKSLSNFFECVTTVRLFIFYLFFYNFCSDYLNHINS